MEKKRFKVIVNGVRRECVALTHEEILNRLKRKWLNNSIDKAETIEIYIYPLPYVETWTPGGWNVVHEDGEKIIILKDVVGARTEYNLGKLKREYLNTKMEQFVDETKKKYLGSNKNYKCAFNHLLNILEYERGKRKEGG